QDRQDAGRRRRRRRVEGGRIEIAPGPAIGRSSMAATTENTLILNTTHGPVTIELRPDLAPNHVARIKELARQGFYDGVVFHRVIDGFMAQTGDPTGHGRGGSGQK